jgi:hypothetical protein
LFGIERVSRGKRVMYNIKKKNNVKRKYSRGYIKQQYDSRYIIFEQSIVEYNVYKKKESTKKRKGKK